MINQLVESLAKSFQSLTIVHRNLSKAKDHLKFSVQFSRDLAIIIFTGPTGAGKTTALRQFADEMLAEYAEEMRDDPSLRPITYTLAVASGHRHFDFKRLYRDALESLKDPFCRSREGRNDGRSPGSILYGESKSAAALREQLEIAFRNHGTKIWIIDEAQHLIGGAKAGGPGPQYDILKSIAQTVGVQLVLCGTHDLPQGIARSGQLSRRSEVITLDRYRWTDKEDLAVFASAISSVMSQIPNATAYPDVKKNLVYFYVHTLGCVGIFKDWVTRAYCRVLQEGASSLSIVHFHQTKLSPRQLATINQEIVNGELEYGQDAPDLDMALTKAILRGAMMPKKKTPPDSKDGGGDASPPSESPAQPHNNGPKSPAGTPFERNPTRDVVGEEA